jgi:hypothetical protein
MQTVAGLFKDESKADLAIQKLKAAEFNREHLGILTREGTLQKVDREEDLKGGTIETEEKFGAGGGAVLGGLAGLLTGVGALAIPGVGPAVAAGVLLATTTGLGAAAGGLLGGLMSLGMNEEEAHVYAEGIKRGGILVVVETSESQVFLVKRILREAGALEIDAYREAWEAADWTGFDETVLPHDDYPRLS